MTQSKKQRLLEKAAQLMGTKELARGLRVDEKALAGWMDGDQDIPDRRLLELAEVLAEYAAIVKG